MGLITIPYKFEPRFYQRPVFEARENGFKRLVLPWHRRAGKEKTLLNLTIKEMCERVGVYFYLFPSYTQAKKAIWDGKDKTGFPFLGHFPSELIVAKHEQELKITIRGGSIFQLIGSDNIDAIMSTNPIGVVFAEYSLQDPRGWDYVRPILRENGGWAAFDFTPRGKNHAYTLYQMALSNPDWFVSLQTIRDTGVLTEADMDAERREGVSEEMIRQEYYCSFEAPNAGSYYGKQLDTAQGDGRIGNVSAETIGVETWWDIGVGDSTAIWFTQTVGREVLVIDYLEASGESLSYYAQELQKKPYVYLSHNGPHDLEVREWASGGTVGRPLSRRETAKALGIDFRIVPNMTIDDGINAARAFLPRCRFDKTRCERGLSALASYHKEYDDKLRMYKSYPAHDWSSHGADAFRYLSVGHKIARQRMAEKEPRPLEIGDYNSVAGQSWLGG